MSELPLSEQDWAVRLYIYEHIVEHIKPPAYDQVAVQFSIAPEDARLVYHRLNEQHHIFLNPGTDEIRMANPFSGFPTDYNVSIGAKTYWANCAWDTLGITAMLHINAVINAVLPVTRENVEFAVKDGEVVAEENLLIHFAVPTSRWYDDLIYTRATMLLFRSEEQVEQWREIHHEPRGDSLSLPQVWELSKAWYGDRMHPDYRGHTIEQAIAIFEQVGLTSTFWKFE